MAKRLYVNCKDYNGSKNVKFIMDKTDSRVDDGTWETIGEVNVVRNSFNYDGNDYQVHSDWSVSKL